MELEGNKQEIQESINWDFWKTVVKLSEFCNPRKVIVVAVKLLYEFV